MLTDKDLLKLHTQTLWDYHNLSMELKKTDVIIALGSHDDRVAKYASHLILQEYAPILVTTGGFGKITKDTLKESEGSRFAKIAQKMGVPPEKILIEETSTNTGENLLNSKKLLERAGLSPQSAILVTKPYMRRRAYATAMKQWPEVDWIVSSPNITLDRYATQNVDTETMINLMVGDLQRIAIYPQKGFQIKQDIPNKVWESYHFLCAAGYNSFLIKE